MPFTLVNDGPTITDWLQTAVNSLSLIVSSAALIATAVLVRHELRVRREETAENLAAQARVITPSITAGARVGHGKYDRLTVYWKVRNDSDHPITRLRVRVISARNPAAYLEALMSPMGRRVLAPGEVHEGASSLLVGRGFARKPGMRIAMLNVDVEFVDARGYWWRKVDDRRPRREHEELARTDRITMRDILFELFPKQPAALTGEFIDIESNPVVIYSVNEPEEQLDELGIPSKVPG